MALNIWFQLRKQREGRVIFNINIGSYEGDDFKGDPTIQFGNS